MTVTLADIEEASANVYQVATRTPIKRSTTLSKRLDATVYLKLENFQKAGSFKIRGAANRIANLSPEEQAAGVVAASAGNHAQGVAMAATRMGISSVLFMPEDAPMAKAAATRGYGAEVRLIPGDYQDAQAAAWQYQKETGATFVHAFEDPDIIAGQGTVGLEILEDIPDVDVVIVPVGGGGLASGLATAIKTKRPECKIVAVQAAGASSLADSLQKGQVISLEQVGTIADGIAVRTMGTQTYEILRELVDEVVTVSEEEIAGAILWLLERAKLTVEGAGAASLAALLQGTIDVAGKKVCVVLSGGNIDITLLSRIIQRGLVSEGRVTQIHARISDKPGAVAELLGIIAKTRASVLHVRHERHHFDLALDKTLVEIELETRGPIHINLVRTTLREHGVDILDEPSP